MDPCSRPYIFPKNTIVSIFFCIPSFSTINKQVNPSPIHFYKPCFRFDVPLAFPFDLISPTMKRQAERKQPKGKVQNRLIDYIRIHRVFLCIITENPMDKDMEYQMETRLA